MKRANHAKSITLLLLALLAGSQTVAAAPEAEDLMPADALQLNCLLPGQVRKLGPGTVYVTQRRAVKIDSSQCQARGGEFFAFSEKK